MENKTLKRVASHTVAVVAGLLLATQCRSPRVSIVEKEVLKEVPVEKVVEKVVEKEVIKWKTKKVYITKVEEVPTVFQCQIHHHTQVANEHRISLLAGLGPYGLKTTKLSNGYKVEMELGPVVGVGYTKMISVDTSFGVQVHSNKSFMADFGLNF